MKRMCRKEMERREWRKKKVPRRKESQVRGRKDLLSSSLWEASHSAVTAKTCFQLSDFEVNEQASLLVKSVGYQQGERTRKEVVDEDEGGERKGRRLA